MVKLKRINNIATEDYDLTLEASAERERVKKFIDDNLGKDYFDKYLKIRNRFTDPNLKDFNKIINLDPEEVKVAIDRYDSKDTEASSKEGKKKVGENEDWIVYHVTSFPAAQELGEGTEWCITGRYGNMDPDDDHYFKDYIKTKNLDGGYYFYIPKDGSNNKYCLLLTKNGKVDSIWESPNGEIHGVGDLNFPDIKGINLEGYEGDSDSLDHLYEELEQAYRDDDSDAWSIAEADISERGGDVDYPTITGCISDNKPNIFGMLLEWGFDIREEIEDVLVSIYEDLQSGDRSNFLTNLPDFDWETAQSVFSELRNLEDKSDFLLDFPRLFSFDFLVSELGIHELIKWIKEPWWSNQELEMDLELADLDICDFLENFDIFDSDVETEDILWLLNYLDDVGTSLEPAFDSGEKLNLYDNINDIEDLSDLDPDFIEGLFNLGARMTKDEAKKLKERIDALEDYEQDAIDPKIMDIIEKSL